MIGVQAALDDPRLAPGLVVAVSVGALAAAFATQYWGGLGPCVLCIYQRYAYGVAIVFGLAGVAVGGLPAARRIALALAGLTFLAGAAIAFFHVGVEQHWWRGTAGCHAPSFDPNISLEDIRKQLLETRFAPCDQIPWSLFGVSMAGYNALFSLGLAAAALWAAWRTGGRRRA
ncbi:MAG: disulfide bond formation protein B [Kiloniellales bacterium]